MYKIVNIFNIKQIYLIKCVLTSMRKNIGYTHSLPTLRLCQDNINVHKLVQFYMHLHLT